MILFINTASPEIITLALLNKKGEVLVKKNIKAKYKQSEKLLVGIEKLSPPDYQQRKISATQIGGCPKGKIKKLSNKEIKGRLKKIEGIIAVKGPGSFTALRIGLTTANTMAFALEIPIVGVMDGELEKMVGEGMKKLQGLIEAPHPHKILAGQGRLNQRLKYVMPEYGMEPNITIKKQ